MAFWKRFNDEEADLRELISNKVDSEVLTGKLNEILYEVFLDPHFEIGQNKDGINELTLSPEGNRATLLALEYWKEAAPKKLSKHWRFYSSRQAKFSLDFTLNMYGVSVNKDNMFFYPKVNTEQQCIDLQIYSESLSNLEEDRKYNTLYILLDQLIGEIYSMEYIGSIDFVSEKPSKEAIDVEKLKDYINECIQNNKWFSPDDILEKCSSYQMEPSKEKEWQLREDIYLGYTSCFPVLNAFYEKTDNLFRTYFHDGIVYGFVFFKNIDIPKDQVVFVRSEIEEKILKVAEKNKVARLIGGATGFYFSYSDFIVFDLEAFLKIVTDVFTQYKKLNQFGFSDFVYAVEPRLYHNT